jgi:hypothetical protein
MLDLATLAATWSEAVQSAAKDQITKGSTITGWAMKAGRKMKFWKDEKLVAEALKHYATAWELKSPAAVIKLGLDLSEDLIGEKQSAPSLVKEKSKE